MSSEREMICISASWYYLENIRQRCENRIQTRWVGPHAIDIKFQIEAPHNDLHRRHKQPWSRIRDFLKILADYASTDLCMSYAIVEIRSCTARQQQRNNIQRSFLVVAHQMCALRWIQIISDVLETLNQSRKMPRNSICMQTKSRLSLSTYLASRRLSRGTRVLRDPLSYRSRRNFA